RSEKEGAAPGCAIGSLFKRGPSATDAGTPKDGNSEYKNGRVRTIGAGNHTGRKPCGCNRELACRRSSGGDDRYSFPGLATQAKERGQKKSGKSPSGEFRHLPSSPNELTFSMSDSCPAGNGMVVLDRFFQHVRIEKDRRRRFAVVIFDATYLSW